MSRFVSYALLSGMLTFGLGCESVPPATPTVATATGSAGVPGTTAVVPTATAVAAQETPPDPEKARALPAGATFTDLVRAARVASGAPHADATCLLRGGTAEQGAVLEAPLDSKMAAALTDPPADLDALLSNPPKQASFAEDGLRFFTAHGRTGGGDFLDLTTFTAVSSIALSSVTPVLLVTDQGIYFGFPSRTGDGKPMSAEDRNVLVTKILPKAQVWIVAAEGAAPIGALREALSMISATRGTVVLASPLASAGPAQQAPSRYDFRVEESAPNGCSREQRSGPTGGRKIGEYDDQAVFKLGDAFAEATKICGENLGIGQGGSIHVLMQITAKGTVESACAETDSTGDVALRACVVTAAKNIKFPKPNKPGIVNFGTSASFVGKPVKPLCDP